MSEITTQDRAAIAGFISANVKGLSLVEMAQLMDRVLADPAATANILRSIRG